MFDNQSEHAFRRLSNLFFSMGDVFENQRGTVQTFVPYYGYVKTVDEDGIPHLIKWENSTWLFEIMTKANCH